MHTLTYFCLTVLHNNMHLMLTFNLDNYAMHFQQQLLRMYKLYSWLATGSIYSYVSLYFIYILYLARLCYESCVLGHQ